MGSWIGVDLDGTLAEYDGWKGIEVIGPPVPSMVGRVKQWLAQGIEVRIVTARANNGLEQIELVREWCLRHIGAALLVTASKDFGMIELWDDRCITVERNTGRIIRARKNRQYI